jgi:proteasome lid subunit RPN8/RPN11
MGLLISHDMLQRIHAHGAAAYPEEGAGLLLGRDEAGERQVVEIFPLNNAREGQARRNRYLITAEDMLAGEKEAMRLGLDVVGIFHSHPDHPNRPSEYDRDWALPWFSYIITSVEDGQAGASRSWRLSEDRERFHEEDILVKEKI